MNNQLVTIKAQLQSIFTRFLDQIIFCYCFGSVATNSYSESSDIDLAFYVHPDVADFDFKLTLYADCSRALKRNDVDIIILNDLPNLILAESVVRHGILLYESNREQRLDYEMKTIHNVIDFRYQRKLAIGE